MKTKTRKTIGKILVWGGVIGIGISTYSMYVPISEIHSAISNGAVGFNTETMLYYVGRIEKSIYINLASLFALLVGGLWGMKK